jgi:hypothetical protein
MGGAFTAPASFDGLGPGLQGILGRLGVLDSNLKLELTILQWVMVSAHQQLTEELALMADVGCWDWSKSTAPGLACTLIDAGYAGIDKTGGPLVGNLQGDDDAHFIHVVNLNLIYRLWMHGSIYIRLKLLFRNQSDQYNPGFG